MNREPEVETASAARIVTEAGRQKRRVRNKRIKDELGVHLQFPTYREGLAVSWPMPR